MHNNLSYVFFIITNVTNLSYINKYNVIKFNIYHFCLIHNKYFYCEGSRIITGEDIDFFSDFVDSRAIRSLKYQ